MSVAGDCYGCSVLTTAFVDWEYVKQPGSLGRWRCRLCVDEEPDGFNSRKRIKRHEESDTHRDNVAAHSSRLRSQPSRHVGVGEPSSSTSHVTSTISGPERIPGHTTDSRAARDVPGVRAALMDILDDSIDAFPRGNDLERADENPGIVDWDALGSEMPASSALSFDQAAVARLSERLRVYLEAPDGAVSESSGDEDEQAEAHEEATRDAEERGL